MRHWTPLKRRSSGGRRDTRCPTILLRWRRTQRGSVRSGTGLIVTDARRGELWLLDLGEPLGHEQGWSRPALVVSSDQWNRHAPTVTVLPLTRTRHDLPTRVEIEPDMRNGLDATSYARCEDIRTVNERRLLHSLGTVDVLVMDAVTRTLRLFLET